MSGSLRLVKKYPNRRLYDTKTSAYITLGDVKDLVLAHEKFKVVDAKSGDELTRNILMQIIIDEEGAGVPLFTTELLSLMIRFYGHATQGMLGQYLEANIKAFVEFQKTLSEQSASLHGENSRRLPSDTWSQFMNIQGPAMQAMIDTYMDQSRKTVHQRQERIKNQALELFSVQPLSGFAAKEARKPNKSDK